MDMTAAIAPRSDQINGDDFLAGPRTFTIQEVTEGSTEQPVNVHLVESPGKPYKPSKSMSRVLVSAWGTLTPAYTGRRLTLYRNADITFGRDKVGGIEISHLSHIDKPLSLALTATRGKKKMFTVAVLAEPVQRDWAAEIDAAPDTDTLNRLWTEAPTTFQDAMRARAAQLTTPTEGAES